MSFLFGGGRPTGEAAIKLYRDQIRGNMRATDRELRRMDAQEKQFMSSLKRLAKESNIEKAKETAKELVRLRAHRKRLSATREGIGGLYQSITEMQSGFKMQEMLAKSTMMLRHLNSQMDLSATHRMLTEFTKQNQATEAKQEMINEAVDEAFQEEGEEQQMEDAMTSVLEEAGFEESLRMRSASKAMTSDELAVQLCALKTSD